MGSQGHGQVQRWQDRWWAVALLVLVVWVGIRLAFDGWSGWPGILVGGFVYAGFMTWYVMRRRRRDARAVGTDAARVPELERQIAKNGELPQDPAEQVAMVRLIRRREEKLRRHSWWAFPLLGLVLFGTPMLWFAAGNVAAGLWGVGFGAAFLGWMVWFNRRFVRRMAGMRQRIEGVGGGLAGGPEAGSAAGPVMGPPAGPGTAPGH
ncbi:hypothetical protein ACFY9Q_16925 [Streptomyces sp. NPDC012389]|uniref:hypothetical protein n=1 Tax=unclassified Streptomyces TaxID=2593676 RepID=UPI00081F3BA2|nr:MULTISPECIES: hypothetical protein [unclassified Streptomyces]MYR92616.1 hypothetical protein [Streptomyces sp. SID4937]SCD37148.1 hypothetical protein GA0115243_101290 [Streptomyces sp. ScaeMP-e83]